MGISAEPTSGMHDELSGGSAAEFGLDAAAQGLDRVCSNSQLLRDHSGRLPVAGQLVHLKFPIAQEFDSRRLVLSGRFEVSHQPSHL